MTIKSRVWFYYLATKNYHPHTIEIIHNFDEMFILVQLILVPLDVRLHNQ